MEVFVPKWLPGRSVRVRAFRAGAPCGDEVKFARGEVSCFSLELDRDGGRYCLSFIPQCNLAGLTAGKDTRVIGAKLGLCEIKNADGTSVELFSKVDQ